MRWIVRLLFLAIITYGILPYYSLYRLNHALTTNDVVQLDRYIDLAHVRENYKRGLHIEKGNQQEGMASTMFRGAANSMSAFTVDQVVTIDWIRIELTGAGQNKAGNSLFDTLDHAFFESPNRFLVRLGELGDNPIMLMLRRDGLVWRLTELY